MDSRRLDSWKEIAAHFGRDERTVRRWEKNEALPVHRHIHHSRGSVYAFQHELDDWQARRDVPHGSRHAFLRPALLILVGVAAPAVWGLSAWLYPADRSAPSVVDDGQDGGLAALGLSAQEGFLLARRHLERRTGFREEALTYLETAVAQAPGFAEGHAWLAEAYLRQGMYQRLDRRVSWSRAEAAARRALDLDDRLPIAHAVMSRILLLRDWNWQGAAAESQRAVELGPDVPAAHAAHALYLRAAGRIAEAVAERERARRADPLNPQAFVFLGDEYLFARRYTDASGAYARALELEPNYLPAVLGLADASARQARFDTAAAWQLRAFILRGQASVAAAFEAVIQRDGPKAALTWLDRRSLDDFQRAPDGHLWDLAYTHARLGHRDAAFRFLRQACDEREMGLLQARVDPDLDSLRVDPKFDELLTCLGPV